ncbi:MAG TPA: helix-turn-helix domain-containing protein [Terriglobales bacterium]|nr:helix-turn-helix domain-containing protein [Terriglobales bacterium]
MTEILTIDEVAAWLKMTRGQVYTLTRKRSQVRMEIPFPVLRLNGNLRFSRSAVEEWLGKIAQLQEAA